MESDTDVNKTNFVMHSTEHNRLFTGVPLYACDQCMMPVEGASIIVTHDSLTVYHSSNRDRQD